MLARIHRETNYGGAMKRYFEPLRQFLFLGIAAWLAYYLTSTHKPDLERIATILRFPVDALQEPKVLLALLTPLIYFVEQVAYRLLFDKKSMFIGTYLSLPADVDKLNIFKIKFEGLTGKYKLNGYAHSLRKTNPIGGWESEKLDMKTTEPVSLSYIYDGELESGQKVRGHVDIKFSGDSPEKSLVGYWVDVDNISEEGTKWQRSKYIKVTHEIKKKLIEKAIWVDKNFPFLHIRRCINNPDSIFKAYYKRQDELARDVEFSRPAPTPRAAN
jgi:hypothetical protein